MTYAELGAIADRLSPCYGEPGEVRIRIGNSIAHITMEFPSGPTVSVTVISPVVDIKRKEERDE